MSHAQKGQDRIRGKWWGWVPPVLGMLAFLVLTVLAAIRYPGGSYSFPDSREFSLSHNYLCDLLDGRAIGGTLNPGSLYARWGLGLLCAGLAYLWYHLPRLFAMGTVRKAWLRWSGLLTFVSLAFLGTDTHDPVVRIAGLLGVSALGILLVALHRAGYHMLFTIGIIAAGLLLLNITMYETGWQRGYLPLVQKLTFGLYFIWFTGLSLQKPRKF